MWPVGTTYCTIGYTGKSWALPCLALPLILDTVLIHTLECFNISCTYTINLSVSFPHSSVVYNIPCNFQRVSGFKRVASFNSKWMSWVACWNLMKKVLLQVLHGPNLLVFVQIMTSRQQCPTFLILSGSFLAPPPPPFFFIIQWNNNDSSQVLFHELFEARQKKNDCDLLPWTWGYLITTHTLPGISHSLSAWMEGRGQIVVGYPLQTPHK